MIKNKGGMIGGFGWRRVVEELGGSVEEEGVIRELEG